MALTFIAFSNLGPFLPQFHTSVLIPWNRGHFRPGKLILPVRMPYQDVPLVLSKRHIRKLA